MLIKIAVILFNILNLLFLSFSIFFVYKHIKNNKENEPTTPAINTKTKSKPVQKITLSQFTCNNCGGAINLNYSTTQCQNCSSEFVLPTDYSEIIQLRIVNNIQLNEIERSFKRYSYYTSTPFKITLIGSLFLIVSTFLYYFTTSKSNISDNDSIFYSKTLNLILFGTTYLFTISFYLTLLIILGKVFSEFITETPRMFNMDDINEDRKESCKSCGAELLFEGNQVSKICCYCGTESFKNKFAEKLKNATISFNLENTKSLHDISYDYKTRIYELLYVPSLVYLAFFILPVIGFIILRISSELI
jgi:predicted RNA-binding Zn-ribbon protein involved in translation (DUF1610 family)